MEPDHLFFTTLAKSPPRCVREVMLSDSGVTMHLPESCFQPKQQVARGRQEAAVRAQGKTGGKCVV